MYRNEQETIVENYPDAYLNIYPVSSESIPMLHFYPNSVFLLVSTIGCNFACEGCISEFQTTRPGTLEKVLTPHTPEQVLSLARESSCRGITFALNEPTVSLPTFLRLAHAAKNEGFLVGCSSNGYMTEDALNMLLPVLDFVNIGLKGSTDTRYQECGVASGESVFRNLKILHDAGVFIEVSTMYICGREEEIIGAAERIRLISPAIPFQVMRFIATHEDLNDMQPDQVQAEEMCNTLRKILDHVYLFNTPATTELDSRCPECGETIIHRVFFGPMAARVLSCRPDGVCSCGYVFAGKGDIVPIPKEGPRVLGGYRSILGAKFVAEFLKVLGVDDEVEIDRLCNTVILNGYLRYLQDQKDSFETFIEMARYLGNLSGKSDVVERLLGYVRAIVYFIAKKVETAEKPRVYTVFCHPLSPMYASKFGNTLVEMAGGLSLNKQEDFQESVHAEYSVEALNQLDPDVIIISGHFSPPLKEFFATCSSLGITCKALSTGRVYIMNSEFTSGNVGWLISLMDVAKLIHPELFGFNLEEQKFLLETVIDQVSHYDDE